MLGGRFRWVICGLLFLGVTKNYMDRQVLGVLKGPLQHEFGWNEIDYGNLVFAFQTAYALGMIFVGRLIDRLGARIGYAAAMVFWSLASMGHALAHSLTAFVIARATLGFGEAGVFPASIKSVAEWFPKKERALATGIFNAGTNIGAIVTPLIVPWIAVHLGWQWAFLLTGALGFAWLILWLIFYRKPEDHSYCTVSEREYIQSDPAAPSDANRPSHLGHLRHFGCWKHRRRLAFLEYDQAGIPRECGAEMGDAFLCFGRFADCHCLPDLGIVVCHASDRSCGSRTSGLFRKSFYADLRSLPFPGRRIRGRHWWNAWGDWRNADRGNRRARAAMDWQLYDSVFHCSIGVPYSVAFDPCAEPKARACTN